MLRIKQNSVSLDNQQQYVPLKEVSVEAIVRSFAANVTIKQIFRNDETTPIEVVYCFPIEEQAAVYAFSAQIDNREIIAQLKEKKQAQQEYNNALEQGHGAYLLEQDETTQDNFIINIGALPPGKECHIQISYVIELDLVENGTKIRFVVPTTIAPRYNPDKGRITSPANTTVNYIQSTPYRINFCCRIEKINIAYISSTSHPIQINLSQQDFYVIEFAQRNTDLDRDIIIDIELEQNRSNTILAIESNAVMASFTPNEQDCQSAVNNNEVKNEFIFVVDCSGSMESENKIEFACQAMLLFLKSLPLNCHFNIIRFGSNYETLFNDITAIYNKENAQQAEQFIYNMQANLGGTELLSPLQWLEEHPSKEGRARQVFLLTDGEISNVNQVLDLCRLMSNSTRIFSFGLGQSPSRSLVKGLARTTNGRFVFIPPDTSVDVYVGEQLEKALQSSITNVQVKWNLNQNVINVPTKTPPVYVNDRLIIYALTTQDDDSRLNAFDHNSNVELFNNTCRLGKAKVNRIPNVSDDGTIARLAAKALILELQHAKFSSVNKKNGSQQSRFFRQIEEDDEKEERKKRIIELSLKYNILSPYTAFIGIEKRVDGNNDDMILREIPIQISTDDQRLETPLPVTSYARLANFHTSESLAYQECIYEQCSNSNRSNCRITTHSLNPNTTVDYNIMKNNNGKQDLSTLDDQSIVRYLISHQMFDGLWDLNSENIEQLIGKPLSHFQQSTDMQVLISAIVILVLKTRFASFSTMWYGVVQKARKRLLDLFENDNKKLDKLLENICKQFYIRNSFTFQF